MSLSPEKAGVTSGLAASILSIMPMLDLLLGHCFYEEGCGPGENIWLLGVLLASCASGVFVGWVVMQIVRFAAKRD